MSQLAATASRLQVFAALGELYLENRILKEQLATLQAQQGEAEDVKKPLASEKKPRG